MTMKKKPGFTLLELMVTLFIIGLLATAATISTINVRKKGRDTKRKADLAQIQSALEMYYDKYKAYPTRDVGQSPWDTSAGKSTSSNSDCKQASLGNNWDNSSRLNDLIIQGFIQKLPTDPTNKCPQIYTFEGAYYDPSINNWDDYLMPISTGKSYCLSVRLETDGSCYSLSSHQPFSGDRAISYPSGKASYCRCPQINLNNFGLVEGLI